MIKRKLPKHKRKFALPLPPTSKSVGNAAIPKTKHYIVTFDLQNSKNRTNDYKRAEDALKFRFGADKYWKLVKQCYIIQTDQTAVDIRSALSQQIGSNCNILVLRLRKGYALHIPDPTKRQEATICLSQVQP